MKEMKQINLKKARNIYMYTCFMLSLNMFINNVIAYTICSTNEAARKKTYRSTFIFKNISERNRCFCFCAEFDSDLHKKNKKWNNQVL